MEKKTNYGKMIAITIAVISAATAIAYVVYRLARKFFSFCSTYDEAEDDESLDLDEMEEELTEEDDVNLFDEDANEAEDAEKTEASEEAPVAADTESDAE